MATPPTGQAIGAVYLSCRPLLIPLQEEIVLQGLRNTETSRISARTWEVDSILEPVLQVFHREVNYTLAVMLEQIQRVGCCPPSVCFMAPFQTEASITTASCMPHNKSLETVSRTWATLMVRSLADRQRVHP